MNTCNYNYYSILSLSRIYEWFQPPVCAQSLLPQLTTISQPSWWRGRSANSFQLHNNAVNATYSPQPRHHQRRCPSSSSSSSSSSSKHAAGSTPKHDGGTAAWEIQTVGRAATSPTTKLWSSKSSSEWAMAASPSNSGPTVSSPRHPLSQHSSLPTASSSSSKEEAGDAAFWSKEDQHLDQKIEHSISESQCHSTKG